MFTCVLQITKLTDLTDAADPAVHFLLSFSHKVENTRRCFHHKEVLSVKVSFYSELSVQHFHLTLFQVDGADWLFGVLALIILQHIRISTHATSSQDKPALPPGL